MPVSQGKELPYTTREACIRAAKEQGVNSSACMKLPAGGNKTTPRGGKMPRPGGAGGAGGAGGIGGAGGMGSY